MACGILWVPAFLVLLGASSTVSVGQQSARHAALLRSEPIVLSGSDMKNAADVEATHPLWTPPKLCKNESIRHAAYYPGLRFCPPVQVKYIKAHMNDWSPPAPLDYWMLDAPAFLAIIGQREPLTKWLVNLGASPGAGTGEDGKRLLADGDHCTPLWPMGYAGLNLEVPGRYNQLQNYLKAWPRARIDTNVTKPLEIASRLQQYGVPIDLDFLKIDVDSLECSYLEQILAAGYRPKVVSIETAPWWPPPLKMMARTQCLGQVVCGCSLQMVVDILKDYTLIQYPFEDAWLVRSEFADMFGTFTNDVWSLYSTGNPNFYKAHMWGFSSRGESEYHKLHSLKREPQEMLEYALKLLRTQHPDYEDGLRQGWAEVNVSSRS